MAIATLKGRITYPDGSGVVGPVFRLKSLTPAVAVGTTVVYADEQGDYSVPVIVGAVYQIESLVKGLFPTFNINAPAEGTVSHVLDLAPVGPPPDGSTTDQLRLEFAAADDDVLAAAQAYADQIAVSGGGLPGGGTVGDVLVKTELAADWQAMDRDIPSLVVLFENGLI